jgi:hypothetical protein
LLQKASSANEGDPSAVLLTEQWSAAQSLRNALMELLGKGSSSSGCCSAGHDAASSGESLSIATSVGITIHCMPWRCYEALAAAAAAVAAAALHATMHHHLVSVCQLLLLLALPFIVCHGVATWHWQQQSA